MVDQNSNKKHTLTKQYSKSKKHIVLKPQWGCLRTPKSLSQILLSHSSKRAVLQWAKLELTFFFSQTINIAHYIFKNNIIRVNK